MWWCLLLLVQVLMNHVVELVGPFLLLAPLRSLRLAGGLLQLVFQVLQPPPPSSPQAHHSRYS